MPPAKKKKSESSSKKSSKRRLVFDDDDDEEEGKQPEDDKTYDEQPPSTTTGVSSSPVKKQRKEGGSSMDASFTSPPPQAKKKKHQHQLAATAKVLVTPEQEKAERQALSHYVPKYIHKTVDYCRQGQASLSDTTMKVFRWIEQHYVIPVDLEQNRAYGPLSGSCYERRVIQAYTLGKLQAKEEDMDDSNVDNVICTCCATVGHERDDCPRLI